MLIMRRMQVFTRSHGSEREHLVAIGGVSGRFKGDFGKFKTVLKRAFKHKKSPALLQGFVISNKSGYDIFSFFWISAT
jgi:hypothetical protein